MKDKFEDILKEKLGDYSLKPESRDWTALERSLGLDAGVRRRTPLYRYAAAAAAALLLAISGVYLFRIEPEAPIVPYSKITTPFRPDGTLSAPEDAGANEALEGVLKLKEAIDRSKEQAREWLASSDRPAETVTAPGNETAIDSPTDGQGSDPATGQNGNTHSQHTGNRTNSGLETNRGAGRNSGSNFRSRESRRTPNSNWGLSLFADGMTHASTQQNPGENPIYFSLADAATESAPRGAQVQLTNSPGSYRIEVPEWKHAIPLTLGFSVRKNLPGNWGVETGINYSYLSSSAETSSANYKQQLHYLGLPLAVTYTPWRASNFELYGRAGGAADFNIAGRRKETYSSMNENVEVYRFNAKGIQWSVSANIGLQYRLSPALGIYFEPGLSYYFENSHQPDSYWKEHPTNFNFKIGVRTNF